MKGILNVYIKITDFLFLLLDYFCRGSILFMTIIVFAQVMLRSLFKMNIPWAEETVLLAMVWMTFAAMAIGVKEEVHIRIEFFMSGFSKHVRQMIVLLDNVILLVVNALMIYYGISLIQFTGISKLPVTGWPASAVFYLIPVSAIASCLALAGKLLGEYKTRSEKNFVEGIYEEESLTEEEK